MRFLKDVRSELKKVTWVSRNTLLKTACAVICFTVFLTTYIYGVDSLSDALSKVIIQSL